MARVLALVEDLMLASRVEGALNLAGHQVRVARELPEESFDLIVCDLEIADAAAVAARPEPALGFYSHLDTAARERGVAAGIDLAVPRSRMSRELPKLVERLLGD